MSTSIGNDVYVDEWEILFLALEVLLLLYGLKLG